MDIYIIAHDGSDGEFVAHLGVGENESWRRVAGIGDRPTRLGMMTQQAHSARQGSVPQHISLAFGIYRRSRKSCNRDPLVCIRVHGRRGGGCREPREPRLFGIRTRAYIKAYIARVYARTHHAPPPHAAIALVLKRCWKPLDYVENVKSH